MRIAIVHNKVSDESTLDEKDVLVQSEAVSGSLKEKGDEFFSLQCSLDLENIHHKLKDLKPDIVFNLVESLGGYDRLIYLFPALLDSLGIAYTGSSSESVFMTTHKILAKEYMLSAGLATPIWIGPFPKSFKCLSQDKYRENIITSKEWIIKSVWDHGSIGLDEDSLIHAQSAEMIEDLLKNRVNQCGGSWFAEKYINGREFNLSLLAGADGSPHVLPPAEILFEGYNNGKPRIVGYRAKWNEDSYEYHHTPRSFNFPAFDESLLIRLKEMAIKCWHLFGLRGYARVDFRVDEKGKPFILEVNINPCLSPDAGYAAALAQAGISYTEAIERILNNT